MSKVLEISELRKLSSLEFNSKSFDKQMSIKEFTKNIFTFNDSDFVNKRDVFEHDMRSIMGIFIEREYFSEA
jgi:hypothetical protein